MFDRYLNYLVVEKTKDKGENESTDESENTSKYKGLYMTKYEAELRYIVCLYVCIKYFATLLIPISFGELAGDAYKTSKATYAAEEFEKKLIQDVLKFCIYRPTVYEIADKYGLALDEPSIKHLLRIYGQLERVNGITADTIFQLSGLHNVIKD